MATKNEELINYILTLGKRRDRRELARKFKIPWECIQITKKYRNIK